MTTDERLGNECRKLSFVLAFDGEKPFGRLRDTFLLVAAVMWKLASFSDIESSKTS